ncbi:MAG: hypothetical protein ACREXP_00240, partial [Steroidobacteraceae bacterium]
MSFINRTTLLAALALPLLFPTQSDAEPPPSLGCMASGCIGVFGSLYVNVSGDVLITKPDGMDTSSLQCTLTGAQYFTLKRTHLGFKEIYA